MHCPLLPHRGVISVVQLAVHTPYGMWREHRCSLLAYHLSPLGTWLLHIKPSCVLCSLWSSRNWSRKSPPLTSLRDACHTVSDCALYFMIPSGTRSHPVSVAAYLAYAARRHGSTSGYLLGCSVPERQKRDSESREHCEDQIQSEKSGCLVRT